MLTITQTRLRRDFSHVPITGLAVFESLSRTPLVLAGEDTHLKVYDVQTNKLISYFKVFDEQPIHGIHVQQNDSASGCKVLVWGSKSVAIFNAGDLESGRAPVIAHGTAPDWIYDGALSPFDTSSAVLATAHNEIIFVRHDEDGCKVVFGKIISPTRPILYTADLVWVSEDCVLMAAGTAFGEIFVWKCWPGEGGASLHEMLFVFTGHEGSVFGVDISPVMALPDGNNLRLLASCSDDRTIRVWDITEREESMKTYKDDHFSAARETGFSATTPDHAQPTLGSTTEIAVAMGHLSRIWGVKFCLPKSGMPHKGALSLYSFGEDSTTQRWQLKLNTGERVDATSCATLGGTLTHEHTFSLHDGKHLWSHAIMAWKHRLLIVTGGADSKVSLIEEPTPCPDEDGVSISDQPPTLNELITIDFQNIHEKNEAQAPKISTKPEIVNRYDFISEDKLLVTTSAGSVLRGWFSVRGLEWKHIHVDDPDLKNIYVLKRTGHGTAILGTTSGNIYFYDDSQTRLTRIGPGYSRKIHDITCLSGETQGEPCQWHFQILCHLFGESNPFYLRFEFQSASQTGNIWENVQISGLDRRFVSVSATRIDENVLVMGSRHGWISVLKRTDDGFSPVVDLASDSRDAITAIVPLPMVKANVFRSSFLATSRDGHYRMYEIRNIDGPSPSLDLIHQAAPSFGPMIEGAWFTTGSSPELILYGFRSRKFIVWNETRREERAHVDCGGAHRTFSFHHGASDLSPLTFAFTKTSKLFIYSQNRAGHETLKKGIHGREIRALASGGGFIATGSEDTSVRIWKYDHDRGGVTGEMLCLATMKKHVTGIQKLHWPKYESKGELGHMYLFSSGGNEEFIVWRVAKPEANYSGLGVVPEEVFAEKSADGDLRILDFDVQHNLREETFFITMAFSNSTFGTYTYRPHGTGFSLHAKGSYTGACLTQVKSFGISQDHPVVLTASTDGHIAIWKTLQDDGEEREWALQHVVKVHQSSIKCLHLAENRDIKDYLVVTGGDDNALAVTTLRKDDYTATSQRIVRKAHAAAINGVAVVEKGSELIALTVSNDQRLKAWKIAADESRGIELCVDVYSGVADAGDIVLLEGGQKVAVAGVGVEIWNLDL